MIAAARVLPGATDTQAYAMAMTFAAEGGMKWAGNGFIAGLSPADIRDAVAAHTAQGTPLYPDLANLREGRTPTATQVSEIYRFVMDRNPHAVGGMKALDQIGDPYAATALFDTLFWSGPSGGAKLVQQAIDGVAELAVPIDGRMGPKTLEAYTRLVKTPSTRRKLFDALAEVRRGWAQNEGQFDNNRIEFFRFTVP